MGAAFSQAMQPPTSSSSSSSYGVFVSFMSKDTHKSFTDQLFAAFSQAGFRTFGDGRENKRRPSAYDLKSVLEGSETLIPSSSIRNPNLSKSHGWGQIIADVTRAIEGSQIAIPIFSPNFAESPWCLEELTEIVRCKEANQLFIIPVFCKVTQFEVGHVKGKFGEGFVSLSKTKEEEEKWRNALSIVADLPRVDCNYEKGWESRLVQRIVDRASKRLKKVIFDATGIDSRFSRAMDFIDISGDPGVRMIGLQGIGGLGKTTLAKEILNRVSEQFQASCFVEDIKERAKCQNGLTLMQEQIISVLVGDRHSKIFGLEHGKSAIRERLKHKRILLILDDVDHLDQLQALAGQCSWFGRGSRVIVTTRDLHVLEAHQISRSNVYNPELLNGKESLALLDSHAFGSPPAASPPQFASISKKIVSADCGLPLAIVIHGSLLKDYNRDRMGWFLFNRLESISTEDVFQKLKISYNLLDDEQQRAFLDIALFLTGYDQDEITYVWHNKSILNELKKKSLVTIDEMNKVVMHDLIRDMGRRIVQEEAMTAAGVPSRICISNSKEANQFLLQVEQVYPAMPILSVEGIHVKSSVEGDLTDAQKHLLVAISVSRLPNLRILLTDGFMTVLPPRHLPIRLPLLRFGILYRTGDTPSYEVFSYIAILKMSNSTVHEWSPDRKLERLGILEISDDPVIQKVGAFSNMPNLVKLRVTRTPNLSVVEESIGCLDKLEELDMHQNRISSGRFPCAMPLSKDTDRPPLMSRLRSLPETITNCINLRRLYLNGTSIIALPQMIGNLCVLEELDLSSCYELTSLPDSISKCTNLRILYLRETSISTLSPFMGELVMLEDLDLSSCFRLSSLPESTGDCTSLKKLSLSKTCINTLPHSIGNLVMLEDLDLSSCSRLSSLPESTGGCTNLKKLSLSKTCINTLPDSIGNLAMLEDLDLSRCEELSSLPDSISNCMSMRRLQLSGTHISTLPHTIDSLVMLEELHLQKCTKLWSLPMAMVNCIHLKSMDLSFTCISTLPHLIGNLTNLEELNLHNCSKLRSLPESASNCINLKKLDLSFTSVYSLPHSIGKLAMLEELLLQNCSKIESLPESISDCVNLKRLDLRFISITTLPDLGKLSMLEELNLASCSTLETLPKSIENANSLKDLCLSHCRKLRTLPNSITNCTDLKRLDLSYTSVSTLPQSISNLTNLEELVLDTCSELRSLPESIGNCTNLKRLDLSCTSISILPESIGNLAMLEELNLNHCRKLGSLPDSICYCRKLKRLNLSSTEISSLPPSVGNLTLLEELRLKSCSNFTSMPQSIISCTTLRRLQLSGTHINTFMDWIKNLAVLEELNLDSCSKLSSLPESISNCTNIKVLDLSNTPISTLPHSISCLNRMERLYLRRCPNLSNLPESIGKCSSLKILHLGNSGINTLPISIGKLAKLEELEVSGCLQLRDLPASINRANNLKRIKVRSSFGKQTDTLLSYESFTSEQAEQGMFYLSNDGVHLLRKDIYKNHDEDQ